MIRKNKKEYKEPELYVDGQKVIFHSSRKERLAMAHNPNIIDPGKKESFFSKKNRSFHLFIINLILLFVLFIIFYGNKANASSIINSDFIYILSLKNKKSSKNIDFKIKIKNISKNENTIMEKNLRLELLLLDINDRIIDKKTVEIQKQSYSIGETYESFVSFKKPQTGTYKAYLYINNERSKKTELKFIIK
jgi:hypothetical protein